MIPLQLSEILQQIDGRIIHGRENPLIKNVVNRTKKEINNHTLLFHIKRDPIRGKYWADKRSVVVVTDVPGKCTQLHESN